MLDRQKAKTKKLIPPQGDLVLLEDVHSPELDNHRDIIVYLPPSYKTNTKKRYPVLYMHDGQNLFDPRTSFAGSWDVHESCERLVIDEEMEEIIVVGIYNLGAERMNEYAPWYEPMIQWGGKGKSYARFIIKTLKPEIDKRFRTLHDRENTGIMGSSMGGLISLYMAFQYPYVFGKVGAMSSSLWFAYPNLFTFLYQRGFLIQYAKLYLDTGTLEGPCTEGNEMLIFFHKRIKNILSQKGGVEGQHFYYLEAQDETHHESFWKKRTPQALRFLFPKKRDHRVG